MDSFNIIVLGVADITSLSNHPEFGLLTLWLNSICDNITKRIPDNFTEIIIYLHDILIDEQRFPIDRHQIKQLLNQKIIDSIPHLDPRIIIHYFSYDPFNFSELSYPHLIIDMAHIFDYSVGKCVKWSSHYEHIPNIQIDTKPIKSIYIGWNNEEFSRHKHVEITEYGTVRTFIDCLEDSGFITGIIHDPVEILYSIIKQMKINLMSIWRQNKGSVKSTEDGGHFDEMFNSFSIMDKIIEKLFNNKTKEEILDFETYDEYHEFKFKLDNPKYF